MYAWESMQLIKGPSLQVDFSKFFVKGKSHKKYFITNKEEMKRIFSFFLLKITKIRDPLKPKFFQHANSFNQRQLWSSKDQNQSQFSKRKENQEYNHFQNSDDHCNYKNYTFKG